ncbi:MAG TPA: DUF2934 domain-containing protein [Polyangia bacterium]|jgi:hypothetical protein|nr:DUF2934 domain-containing protein [Polyangia bacterium]
MADDKASNGPGAPNSEAIAKRAYELFLQRGSIPGFELDDWLQAEAELVSMAAIKKTSVNGKTSRQTNASAR